MTSVKVVVVGDDNTGKTHLIKVYINGRCQIPYVPTVFDNYSIFKRFWGKTVSIDFLDTAGHDDYDKIRHLTYTETDVFLVVFSVVNPLSFVRVTEKWIPECLHYCPGTPILLVGNKSDLRNERREWQVTKSEIMGLCTRYNLRYVETSAITLQGINECMETAVKLVIEHSSIQRRYNLFFQGTIIRHFMVDKLLSAKIKDWVDFGVSLSYKKSTLKKLKSSSIQNPFWCMLKTWAETLEQIDKDFSNILYKALKKHRQHGLAQELSIAISDGTQWGDRFDPTTAVAEILRDNVGKSEMKQLSEQLDLMATIYDQTPPIIWKMGPGADTLYKELLQTGVEKRYVLRIMIVGPFGVGKTCLMRRLLKKQFKDVVSTDGINVLILTCKVRIQDGTWILCEDTQHDADQEMKSRLCKQLLKSNEKSGRRTRINTTQDMKTEMSVSETIEPTKEVHPNYDIETSTKLKEEQKHENLIQTEESNEETIKTAEDVQPLISKSTVSKCLLEDFKDFTKSNISIADFAEVSILDFAGQYEFYATHQTFLNKHAIFLLALDISKDLKGLVKTDDDNLVDLAEIPFEDIGGYINFWMDAIHCYAEKSPEENETGKCTPSVIVVGTCSDKLKEDKAVAMERVKDQLNKIIGNHPKKHHIKDFIVLSNYNSPESEFDILRNRIFQLASDIENWGQELPVRWIKMEQAMNRMKVKNTRLLTYQEVSELGQSIEFPIQKKTEMDLFLKYQHESGNIIYFEDIPEIIILQPQWLVDVLKCLVTAPKFLKQRKIIYIDDWENLIATGKLTNQLIRQLITEGLIAENEDEEFITHMESILRIMEKFDIIVRPNRSSHPDNQGYTTDETGERSTNSYSPDLEASMHGNSERSMEDVLKQPESDQEYYVPCLIRSKPIGNIVENFKITGKECQRTSWICMDFHFLPPAFFNHVLVSYIKTYEVSLEPMKRGSRIALYRGMGVFNLDSTGCNKLAVCVYGKVIQFQIWSWDKLSDDVNHRQWEHAEETIERIKQRYKINVNYSVKLKCCDGSHDSLGGMIDVDILRKEERYFCNEHRVGHDSKDLLKFWFKNEEEPKNDAIPDAKDDNLKDSIHVSIERYSHAIIHTIVVGGIMDHMITKCVITTDDRRQIEHHASAIQQNKAILDLVVKRGTKAYLSFIDALRNNGYEELAMLLENDQDIDPENETLLSPAAGLPRWTIPLSQVRLQKNYKDIVTNIRHDAVVDHLISSDILTIDDKQDIDACPAQTDKNRKLMDKLVHCGEKGYAEFLCALHDDEAYSELAKQIEDTDVGHSDLSTLQQCFD